jgi:quinol monooxygenase YgiN
MVQVTVCLAAKGGSKNELVEALLPLMQRAAQSPGCSGAHVCADVSDARVLWYHEDWQDAGALEARVRSEQFTRLLALMETSAQPPVLEFRTIEYSRGLDYVAAVREAARWDE